MGEIRPKECEPRELTKDQLAGVEEWTERLELFARGLRPGWTAVGNEVLAQQQLVREDVRGVGGTPAQQQQQGLFVPAEA